MMQYSVDEGGPATSVDNDGDKESGGETSEAERTLTDYTSDDVGQKIGSVLLPKHQIQAKIEVTGKECPDSKVLTYHAEVPCQPKPDFISKAAQTDV